MLHGVAAHLVAARRAASAEFTIALCFVYRKSHPALFAVVALQRVPVHQIKSTCRQMCNVQRDAGSSHVACPCIYKLSRALGTCNAQMNVGLGLIRDLAGSSSACTSAAAAASAALLCRSAARCDLSESLDSQDGAWSLGSARQRVGSTAGPGFATEQHGRNYTLPKVDMMIYGVST